jgi:hypothetical protein
MALLVEMSFDVSGGTCQKAPKILNRIRGFDREPQAKLLRHIL